MVRFWLSWIVLGLTVAPVALAGDGSPTGAPAPGPPADTVPTPRPTVAVDPADVSSFKQDVEHLASEPMAGRLPGSPGGQMARDWLVGRFKAAPLEPVFGRKFTQAFEVSMGVEVKQSALRFDGKTPPAGAKYTPLGMSADGKFDADAVFVGYAIVDEEQEYDSFAGAAADALKGKVAVMYRYEPLGDDGNSRFTRGENFSSNAHLATKAKLAIERGAAAVVIVNPPAKRDAVMPSTASSLFGRRLSVPVLMIDVAAFKGLLKRAGCDDPAEKAAQLEAAADAGPIVEPLGVKIAGKVELRTKKNTASNVVAIAPGAGALADQVIVIGAHYDHLGRGLYGSRTGEKKIHPGADDNASGTAGLVLLADRFAQRLAHGEAPANRRAIVFFGFDAEERGLVGSRYFTSNLDESGIEAGRIVAMLNMDMIGRLRDDKVRVGGVDSAKGWRDRVKRAAEAVGVEVVFGGSPHGPSDHASFYRAGIPVLHAFTGLHADYHTPKDTADKVNFEGGVKVANLVDAIAQQLWAEPTTVAYAEVKRSEGRGGARRAFLGIMPDMVAGDGAAGVPIASVSKDSPADKGGMKDGDRVVAFAGKPIGDFADLRAALATAKPGKTVKLTVERDGKRVELDVALGKR